MAVTHPGHLEIATRVNAADCRSCLERAADDGSWLDEELPRPGGGDDGRSHDGGAGRPDNRPPRNVQLLEPMLVMFEGGRVVVRNVSDGSPPHPLRRILYAEIVERPDGAVIRGRFRLPTVARLGLSLWFACTGAIAMLLVAGMVTGEGNLPSPLNGWTAVAVTVVFIGAAVALVRAGLAQSRAREAAIAAFLRRIVDSRSG
jgi:hypothetical protein